MADNLELKACPFCGGVPELVEREFTDDKASYGDSYVGCKGCGTDQPYRATKAEAIAAWNTRTPTPPAGDGWLPIESAPKDGRFLVIDGDGRHDIAVWHRDHVCGENEGWCHFVAWQPLPAPPALNEQEG